MEPLPLLITRLPDRELVTVVSTLVAAERRATAALIEALTEFDARRLYLEEGCSSLFAFCTERLHLSESAAYHRITAAKAARRFPMLLDRLRDGALTMTAIGLLAPHLSEENCGRLTDAARHRSKREIEKLVAAVHPRPDVTSTVRKLPAPRAVAAEAAAAWPRTSERSAVDAPFPGAALLQSPGSMLEGGRNGESEQGEGVGATLPAAAANVVGGAAGLPRFTRPAVIRPLAPARYQIQVTVSEDTHHKLRRAQDLLRHVIPDGNPAAVIDRALTMLVAHLERAKWAAIQRGPAGEGPSPAPVARPATRASARGSKTPGSAARLDRAPSRTR